MQSDSTEIRPREEPPVIKELGAHLSTRTKRWSIVPHSLVLGRKSSSLDRPLLAVVGVCPAQPLGSVNHANYYDTTPDNEDLWVGDLRLLIELYVGRADCQEWLWG